MISIRLTLAAAADAAVLENPLSQPHPWAVDLLAGVVWVGMVVIFASMLMAVYRLIKGPHLADRAMAVDTIAILLIGFVVLLSLKLRVSTFIDGILVLSLLGFAGTVAMAQFIARPHMTEHVRRADTGGAAADPRQ